MAEESLMALEGRLVSLREEREKDLPFLLMLRNDLETQAWSKSLPLDFTLPMYHKRFHDREFSFDRKDGRFMIDYRDTGETVGYLGYYGFQPRHNAIIGIAIAKKFWGKGLAFDAQEVLLEFLFEELGLRVARMYTHTGNLAMIKLAQKSGFKIATRQREAVFKGGKLYDNLTLDILREEYYARHRELEDHLPAIGWKMRKHI
jgi:[ribosomal protein S5]-alanine N-acetyltransferase